MRKSTSEDGWQAFLELCCTFRSPTELEGLFDLFLSLEEKETLSKRYRLIKSLLEEKLTQREISEELGISISQITRGSNALKIITDELREVLKTRMASQK